ncbi:hypothetical protein NX059_006377 [Plenodomus lindquistii]|nr:hypothetical protein NX059_006377 [Plenodomus lindquistii]
MARQDSAEWDGSQGPLHLDTAQANLVIRPQAASAAGNHKAPLAPKQGLGGALVNARGQHQSPIAGTYALRTPRGKITSIACESCRKRKSKCDGVRPKCNTCQSKNLTCVYDVAEDGKTTTQLRAHVRRLAKDADDLKSLLVSLVMAPNRNSAAVWAAELEKNGFMHHSVEEVRKALADPAGPTPGLPEGDSFGTPTSEHFSGPAQNMGASSYEGSSREERQVGTRRNPGHSADSCPSREQSQPSMNFGPEPTAEAAGPLAPQPLSLGAAATALQKFGYDCAYYRRIKRDLLQNGFGETNVFGRTEIDVDTLLLCFLDPQDEQPVSTWCSRTINKLLPASPLPVRLASTWLLTKLMRYLIWPTVETVRASPEWLMPPSGRQEVSPFDLLIDLVPWPQVRQLLYAHPQEYPVANLVGLIGITWPYADDACHYWDIEAGQSRMTPLFESTVADLNNWIIDPKILETIPQLEGHIPVKPVA